MRRKVGALNKDGGGDSSIRIITRAFHPFPSPPLLVFPRIRITHVFPWRNGNDITFRFCVSGGRRAVSAGNHRGEIKRVLARARARERASALLLTLRISVAIEPSSVSFDQQLSSIARASR